VIESYTPPRGPLSLHPSCSPSTGKDGIINPAQLDNIPGLEALDSADLMVILTRFRDLLTIR